MTTYIACTGGAFNPECTGPVSPDDPDNELCSECLSKHVLKLVENIESAIKDLTKYRRAASP